MARSLVTVVFGNNQTMLLNSNCSSINLLEVLKQKLGLNEEVDLVLDLADVHGNLLHLQNNLRAPACNFLNDKKFYVAVRKQAATQPDDTLPIDPSAKSGEIFIPLVQDCSRICPDYQPPFIADSENTQPTTRRRKDPNFKATDTLKKSDQRKSIPTK